MLWHLSQEAAAGRARFRCFLQQRRHPRGVDVHKQPFGQPDRRQLHRKAPKLKSSYSWRDIRAADNSQRQRSDCLTLLVAHHMVLGAQAAAAAQTGCCLLTCRIQHGHGLLRRQIVKQQTAGAAAAPRLTGRSHPAAPACPVQPAWFRSASSVTRRSASSRYLCGDRHKRAYIASGRWLLRYSSDASSACAPESGAPGWVPPRLGSPCLLRVHHRPDECNTSLMDQWDQVTVRPGRNPRLEL